MKITGTLKNASRVPAGNGEVLIGNVYGDIHGRFRDGQVIRTSYLVAEDGDTFTTRNSVYKVESWA